MTQQPRRRLTTPITLKLRTGLIEAIRAASVSHGTSTADVAGGLMLEGIRTILALHGVSSTHDLSPDDLADLYRQAQAHLSAASAKIRDGALAEIVKRSQGTLFDPAPTPAPSAQPA